MKKSLIAICLLATILVTATANSVAAASEPSFFAQGAPEIGLLTTNILAQAEATEPKDTLSVWDRTWPILIAVGSFLLFRFLRNRPDNDD